MPPRKSACAPANMATTTIMTTIRDDDDHGDDASDDDGVEGGEEVGTGSARSPVDESAADELRRKRQNLRRRYKIQDVIQRRQVLLVQVVKEERGNKGAALTTYLSLAGRYCVLMPNTSHGGGISRKISNGADRKRLKSIMSDLNLPTTMGLIVRTAGLSRTKIEIKRDFDYLARLWDEIREKTLSSSAPALIYRDSDLIKRAIRDLYHREIDEVIVEGDEGYKAARGFMKLLMPSHVKRVIAYRDPTPVFQRYGVEDQLSAMYHPVVQLKSGGYLVINPTEALVSIDINSGRSTREHNIEQTAFATNIEAAHEIARQLRLRDMAGLVVIDFIDMEQSTHNRKVEKAMKDALKNDRARIQVGRISSFGLMEMSRQRLRTGVLEASTKACPHCEGTGLMRTASSSGLSALRIIEDEAARARGDRILLRAGREAAVYVLNKKRGELAEIEERYGVTVEVMIDEAFEGARMSVESSGARPNPKDRPVAAPIVDDEDDFVDEVEVDEDEAEEAEDDERPARREGGRDGARETRARATTKARAASAAAAVAAVAAIAATAKGRRRPSAKPASRDAERAGRASDRRARRRAAAARPTPRSASPSKATMARSASVRAVAAAVAAAAAARRMRAPRRRRCRGRCRQRADDRNAGRRGSADRRRSRRSREAEPVADDKPKTRRRPRARKADADAPAEVAVAEARGPGRDAAEPAGRSRSRSGPGRAQAPLARQEGRAAGRYRRRDRTGRGRRLGRRNCVTEESAAQAGNDDGGERGRRRRLGPAPRLVAAHLWLRGASAEPTLPDDDRAVRDTRSGPPFIWRSAARVGQRQAMTTGARRFVRFFMLALALGFAAAQPAAAQSVLRDSETELLFRDMSKPLIEAAKLDPASVKVVLVNDPEINAFVAHRAGGLSPHRADRRGRQCQPAAGGHRARTGPCRGRARHPHLRRRGRGDQDFDPVAGACRRRRRGRRGRRRDGRAAGRPAGRDGQFPELHARPGIERRPRRRRLSVEGRDQRQGQPRFLQEARQPGVPPRDPAGGQLRPHPSAVERAHRQPRAGLSRRSGVAAQDRSRARSALPAGQGQADRLHRPAPRDHALSRKRPERPGALCPRLRLSSRRLSRQSRVRDRGACSRRAPTIPSSSN